jgi:D-tagatose-1,6-bisphosphate aldolase subunit GatZ/KbaZ
MSGTDSTNALLGILNQNKNGTAVGVFSVCSANRFVLESAIREARRRNSFILIEATCNQVNQFGGYTGMTPLNFRKYVESIAANVGLPMERVILGGDHLGPYPWRHLPGEKAMQYSVQMVKEYAAAGFQKIHLDASMYCADDDFSTPLSKDISAKRAVHLCSVIEAEFAAGDTVQRPVYVIGTEVPVPGGQQEAETEITVTTPEDVDETISIHRDEFQRAGLDDAFERVVAVVVQPGVEFRENEIIDYDRGKIQPLKQYIKTVPGMVYEAHSTDYQMQENLRAMVEDHFAILKVGPALTFAFREALLGLIHVEELLADTAIISDRSNLLTIIKQVMNENPSEWEKYLVKDAGIELAKVFSYSDRIRYYWENQKVQAGLGKLLNNLQSTIIPMPVIKQYFPNQYEHIREGLICNAPKEIIHDHIADEIKKYADACELQ